jgi:hypothetical protein
MQSYPRLFIRFVLLMLLALVSLLFVPTTSAQAGPSISITPNPLIAYTGHQLHVVVQIGNGGSTLLNDVGIQCFVSLDGSFTKILKGPFKYASASTATYIEYGANLTNNTYPDNVDLNPGQNKHVEFNFSVTAAGGATGLVECFLIQFRPEAGGFFLLTQTSAPVMVLPVHGNKHK